MRAGVLLVAGWGYRARGLRPYGGLPLRARIAVAFFCLATLLATGLWVVDVALREPIRAWAEARAVNLATRAIAQVVAQHLAPELSDRQLVTPVLDSSGRISGFQYAMGEINRLESQAAQLIEQRLSQLSQERLLVPMGQMTGIHWLAAAGPSVPVRIIPVGHVRTNPKTDFKAVGINQVLHRIYVDVDLTMRVVTPLIDTAFPVNHQIVLTERIIIGEVPQFFMQWGGGSLHNLPDGSLVAPLN